MEASSGVVGEVNSRIAEASRVFGSLRDCIYCIRLTMGSKRMMYISVVLGVLLYGAETWAPTEDLVVKLDRFHQRCVHCI